jgi:predicted nucleic acid-binding protein
LKPVNEAEVRCRDRNDQKFLDCAHTERADYLVTGDPDLLDATGGTNEDTQSRRAPKRAEDHG